MVKFIKYITLLTIIQSCCYKGVVTQYKQPRDIIKSKKYSNKIYQKIDTMVLYKEIGRIDNDYFYNTDNSKFGNNFLRFYGSGKFSVFNRVGYDSKNHKLLSNYKISREDFNPEKSQMGVIYDVEKIIYTRHLIINQCKADISNAILTIKGDSLYLKSVGHPHMGTRVYMKYNINNTFLEGWKPDW